MAYNLEEQESLANLKAWWEKWGNLVMAAVCAVCLATAGYNGYKWYKQRETAKASVSYAQLLSAVNTKDDKNIRSISEGLIDKYGSTVFGPMGAFASARHAMISGDRATAESRYRWVIDKSGRPEFEAVARVRLAGLLSDAGENDKALDVLTAFKPSSDPERLIVADKKGDVFRAMGRNGEADKAWREAEGYARPSDPMTALIRLKIDSLPDDGSAR